MRNIILKALVGSQANGLADENSDFDYRGVFVLPTEEILSLKNVGGKYKANDWFEGKEDHTLYEIGHFLKLACKCNPSVLEVFKAPMENLYDKKDTIPYSPKEWTILCFSQELRELFPYVWNPNDAFNAFVGYSNNQRKKLLDNKDNRGPKFACAYLRTLYNLKCLLKKGDFTLDVTHNPQFFKRLKDIRNNNFTMGDVINEAEIMAEECKLLRDKCLQKANLEKVNEFLIKIRKEFWK